MLSAGFLCSKFRLDVEPLWVPAVFQCHPFGDQNIPLWCSRLQEENEDAFAYTSTTTSRLISVWKN